MNTGCGVLVSVVGTERRKAKSHVPRGVGHRLSVKFCSWIPNITSLGSKAMTHFHDSAPAARKIVATEVHKQVRR